MHLVSQSLTPLAPLLFDPITIQKEEEGLSSNELSMISPESQTEISENASRENTPQLLQRTSSIHTPIPLKKSRSASSLLTPDPSIEIPPRPASAAPKTAPLTERLACLLHRLEKILVERDERDVSQFFNDLNGLIETVLKDIPEIDLAEFSAYLKLDSIYEQFANRLSSIEMKAQAQGLHQFYKELRLSHQEETPHSLSIYLQNLNESDNPQANRIKASKYEAILRNITSKEKKWFELLQKTPHKEDVEVIQLLGPLWGVKKHLNENECTLEYLNLIRSQYRDVALTAIRNAARQVLSPTPPSPLFYQFVCELCADLYTETSLTKENELLISTINPHPKKDGNLVDELNDMMDAYNRAPASLKTNVFNRLGRSFNDFFDNKFSPLNAGNPAQKMFIISGKKKQTIVLGMGCPTIQEEFRVLRGSPKAEVDPIFLAYLMCKRGSHLYTSTQDHRHTERERGDKLLEIPTLKDKEGKPLYPHFFVVVFCKNSDFYKYGGSSTAEEFKTELKARFLDENCLYKHGCLIPETIFTKIELTHHLDRIATRLHYLFKNKNELTVKERNLFTDLFDVLLLGAVNQKVKPDYFNITCRDAIDRGVGFLAEYLNSIFLSLVENLLKIPSEHTSIIIDTLFPRAHWARKRAPMQDRFNRFRDNAQLLNEILKDPSLFILFQELVKEFIPVVEIKKV